MTRFSSSLRRLAVATVLLASVALGPPAAAAPTAPAAPVAAAATLSGTQPDIVLLLTDDQTWDSLKFMPYLQSQVAAGQYVTFSANENNNPLCCPARASILSGLVDTRTGVINNRGAASFDPTSTVGLALQNAGYRTGMFGKLLNGYNARTGSWPGWNDFQPLLTKGLYNQYNFQEYNNGVIETYGSTAADYQVDVLTAKATRFIDAAPRTQPMFLYLAPTATHTPWVPAPRHDGAYATTKIPLPPNWGEADVSDKPAWVQQLPLPGRSGSVTAHRKQYTAALGVDDMLRSVDERLAATGRADNTVVIFLSDNGLAQGSNRWPSKMCELAGCEAAPLLVRYPGQAGRTDPRLTSNIDMAATMVDLAGTSMPSVSDGVSLVPALEDPSLVAATTHAGLLEHWGGGNEDGGYTDRYTTPGYYGIRTARWRYVEVTNLAAPDRREYELYDERSDPFELQNHAGDPAYAATQAALKTQLYDLVTATGEDPNADQGRWVPNAPAPTP